MNCAIHDILMKKNSLTGIPFCWKCVNETQELAEEIDSLEDVDSATIPYKEYRREK